MYLFLILLNKKGETMDLENFIGEIERPLLALDIIIKTTENKMEDDWEIMTKENYQEFKKVFAMFNAMRYMINNISNIKQKYKKKVEQYYKQQAKLHKNLT